MRVSHRNVKRSPGFRIKYAKRADEIRAEREAKEQEARERREAEAEQKRQAKNAETEAMLRRRFLTAGGSAAEWEVEKSKILGEYRRRQMTEQETADDRARAAHRARYRSF